MTSRRIAIAALGVASALGGWVYALLVRPHMSRWGAADEEVRMALPGDELDSPIGYRPISKRAITIDAPPEEAWPWLV
jgi:hypothetical protein